MAAIPAQGRPIIVISIYRACRPPLCDRAERAGRACPIR